VSTETQVQALLGSRSRQLTRARSRQHATTGDVNYDEAKRTFELFVTEVLPELEPSALGTS
jgi:hypothetical protein